MARQPITKAHPYTPKTGRHAGETFSTERSYRNALAQDKGFASWHAQQRAARKVTAKSFAGLRDSQQQARARALDALAKVRRGASLTQAAKQAGTTPNTVHRYAGSALRREHGRTVASGSDRIYRQLNLITTDGRKDEVPLRTSRQASLVGRHADAIKRFLASGDDAPLRKFRGVKVAGYELESDPAAIEELERTSQLDGYEPYDK